MSADFTSLNESIGQAAGLAVNISLSQGDIGPYLITLYASAYLFSFLSPITVVSNGLLLVAIYKDPFKCFRTPVTFFIISLAIVDLLTGTIVEPCFAIFYFVCYSQQTLDPSQYFVYLFQIASFLSLVLLSSSFLLVLALTTTQYIAITYPHKYKQMFTKKRVLVFVSGFFIYFAIFSSLQFTKIPKEIYLKINLHLHPTVIGLLLIIAHILLFKSFRKFVQQSKALRRSSMAAQQSVRDPNLVHPTGQGNKSETKHQKQLTVVALLLSALLLLCSIPHIVTFYVYFYTEITSFTELANISIALRVSDMILFIKVALDAYIYAWRHPKYRKAVKGTMLCYIKQVTKERDTEQELVATASSSKVQN